MLRSRGIGLHAFDSQFEGAFDVAQFDGFGTADQRGSDALGAGASGTSDAVNEVFRHLGQVVVDDVSDVVHVQATGGDVGGNQNLRSAILESAERVVALRLRTVAVNQSRTRVLARRSAPRLVRAKIRV